MTLLYGKSIVDASANSRCGAKSSTPETIRIVRMQTRSNIGIFCCFFMKNKVDKVRL